MNLLAIVGSPRPKGNTNYLVEQALKEATKLGAKTEKITLTKYEVKPCVGHDNCASFEYCLQQDDTAWILDKFCKADGVILATPVYWYNLPAQMKAFIDRNYFLYTHDRKSQAKAVGIIIVAEMGGIQDTLYTLKQFIDWIFEVEEDRIFIACGYANKLGEAKSNHTLVEDARKLGRQMVQSLTGTI